MLMSAGILILEIPRKCPFIILDSDISSIKGHTAIIGWHSDLSPSRYVAIGVDNDITNADRMRDQEKLKTVDMVMLFSIESQSDLALNAAERLEVVTTRPSVIKERKRQLTGVIMLRSPSP